MDCDNRAVCSNSYTFSFGLGKEFMQRHMAEDRLRPQKIEISEYRGHFSKLPLVLQ
jgi:hypothetical protein